MKICIKIVYILLLNMITVNAPNFILSFTYLAHQLIPASPILGQCLDFIPPEITRKPKAF